MVPTVGEVLGGITVRGDAVQLADGYVGLGGDGRVRGVDPVERNTSELCYSDQAVTCRRSRLRVRTMSAIHDGLDSGYAGGDY